MRRRIRLKNKFGAYDNQKSIIEGETPNPYAIKDKPHGKSDTALNRWENAQWFFNKWKIKSAEQTLVKTPAEIIKEAQTRFGKKKFVVLYSGGKDSSMCADLLNKMGLLDHVLTIDTGEAIDELWPFMRDETKRQGWHHVIRKTRQNFNDYVYRYGNPASRAHHFVMGVLKGERMRQYYNEELNSDYIYVSGIRAPESKERARNYSYHINKEGSLLFVSPIFYKTTQEVLDYVTKHKINLSPVYKSVHISGDCTCTANGDEIEKLEIRIHYPENYKRILEREKIARESPYKQAQINWEVGNVKSKADRVKIYDGLCKLFNGLVPSLKDQFDANALELSHACSDCSILTSEDSD